MAVCSRYGGLPEPPEPSQKVGIAENVRTGLVPINGLRHRATGDTSGWYIWAGEELSSDPDFFAPLHVHHLEEWCPVVIDYLALPPGFRFLLAGEHVDVWFDATLLADDASE
jgi:hypothetical protein